MSQNFHYLSRSGEIAFTLIELLVVVGILSTLSTVVVTVINPAQLIKQSRDATRLSDIETILKALQVYQGSGVSESTMGTSNTIYVSVPAINSNCSDLNLPSPLTGWAYHCSTSADYTKTDGTGWIPVNFLSMSYGSPLDRLPTDPINATSTGLYYTYIHGSIALSTGLESEKYLASSAINDQGYSYARYEAGSDLAKNTYLPNCGGFPVTDIDGNIYSTVQIGRQCWMKENMMTTKYPGGTSIARSPLTTWSTSDSGQYGYPANTTNTAEESLDNIKANKLGFLYQWSAAMNGSTTPGAQGICPNGWHIPTYDEWTILLKEYATDPSTCTAVNGNVCDPAGSHLSLYTLNGDNSSGFSAMFAGHRKNDCYLCGRSSYTIFWTSNQSYTSGVKRGLGATSSSVNQGTDGKVTGFSVRCLKNS